MTVINRVWDKGLGRTREPYAWELPSWLRGPNPERETARDRRRAERDAAARRARQGRTR